VILNQFGFCIMCKWPLHLAAHIFKTPKPICMIFLHFKFAVAQNVKLKTMLVHWKVNLMNLFWTRKRK